MQNGYEEFLSHCHSTKKNNPCTINNVIAAVKYFAGNVATDEYSRSIRFERLKSKKPEKQESFPLKYYEKKNLEPFLALFKGDEDLKLT